MFEVLQVLTDKEIRVLGCLLEKSKTTPEYYPLTLNAITVACNQKSSRKPIVDYSESEVMDAINGLKGKNLVSLSVGASSRTNKFKHNFSSVYSFPDSELAILCLLFLRGPLTPGEINSNSGRLFEFSSIESVLLSLNNLCNRDQPLVKLLERKPGQKEARYIHLFCEYVENEVSSENIEQDQSLIEKINTLELKVNELSLELLSLKDKLKDIL